MFSCSCACCAVLHTTACPYRRARISLKQPHNELGCVHGAAFLAPQCLQRRRLGGVLARGVLQDTVSPGPPSHVFRSCRRWWVVLVVILLGLEGAGGVSKRNTNTIHMYGCPCLDSQWCCFLKGTQAGRPLRLLSPLCAAALSLSLPPVCIWLAGMCDRCVVLFSVQHLGWSDAVAHTPACAATPS